MDKLNENQNKTLTKVTLSVNDESEVYPLLLTDSQLRLLRYLENMEFFDSNLYIDYEANDYKKI